MREQTAMWSAALAATLLSLAGAGLSGCAGASQALGLSKTVPDEFRVVAKAPLVVPPDFALRPPRPGEPRPQELQPESQARVALFGAREATTRSAGETLLANKAGAEKADPLIRYVMDDEFGAVAHKEKPFADRVMFWKKGEPQVAAADGQQAAPIDPSAEEAKVRALTGDQPVVIARAPTHQRIKLPGL